MYHAALTYLIFVAPCMKSMQACTKTHHFEITMQKFSAEGTPPPQSPPPRRLYLCAYGAQAQRDTQKKS